MKKVMEDCISNQCKKIEIHPNKNNNKRAHKLVKDLVSQKRVGQQLSRTGLGKCLQESKRFSADGQNIAFNYISTKVVLTMQFLTAVSPWKKIYNRDICGSITQKGVSPGVDNIQAHLVQADGQTTIDVIADTCNNV